MSAGTRILILTWLFEPHATPRAIRWRSIVQEFLSQGCSVDVITAAEPGLPRREERGKLRIFRCGGSLLNEARQSVTQSRKSSRRVLQWAGRLAQLLYSGTWKRIYWPDKACPWILPVVRTANHLLARHCYDAMISVSLPFSAHVAAFCVKHRHPDLNWLADSGDPFAFQQESSANNACLYAGLNRRAERRIFAAADHLSVTTDATSELYASAFPESAAKLTTIPPLVGSDVMEQSDAPAFPRRLLFLGSLYQSIRNPAYLLALFEQLQAASGHAYELHFMGDARDCAAMLAARAQPGSGVILHGQQSRAVAMQALREAGVVVNIGNTHAYQLPSKLVEYAAAGKRILNIASCAQDSSEAFLRSYPLAFTIQNAEAPTPAHVSSLLAFLGSTTVCCPASTEKWLSQFRPNIIARAYLSRISHRPDELNDHVATLSLPAALSA